MGVLLSSVSVSSGLGVKDATQPPIFLVGISEAGISLKKYPRQLIIDYGQP